MQRRDGPVVEFATGTTGKLCSRSLASSPYFKASRLYRLNKVSSRVPPGIARHDGVSESFESHGQGHWGRPRPRRTCAWDIIISKGCLVEPWSHDPKTQRMKNLEQYGSYYGPRMFSKSRRPGLVISLRLSDPQRNLSRRIELSYSIMFGPGLRLLLMDQFKF